MGKKSDGLAGFHKSAAYHFKTGGAGSTKLGRMGTSAIRIRVGRVALAAALVAGSSVAAGGVGDAVEGFSKAVQPVLAKRCYDCHGDGDKKGGVALDESPAAMVANHELWAKVLKNVRAGLMPPAKKGKLPEDEKRRLEQWVKYSAFGLDPGAPDPGRVTIRRLNRAEYRNTIRDLMGVDFRADE